MIYQGNQLKCMQNANTMAANLYLLELEKTTHLAQGELSV